MDKKPLKIVLKRLFWIRYPGRESNPLHLNYENPSFSFECPKILPWENMGFHSGVSIFFYPISRKIVTIE